MHSTPWVHCAVVPQMWAIISSESPCAHFGCEKEVCASAAIRAFECQVNERTLYAISESWKKSDICTCKFGVWKLR